MKKELNRVPQIIGQKLRNDERLGIVLFGESNCGKSSTLMHLMVLLCGGGILYPTIQAEFEKTFFIKKHNKYRDAEIVVPYQMSNNQCFYVYISTRGDSWPIIEDNYRFFYQCIRPKHNVYIFNGKSFELCKKEDLEKIPAPQFCINPASYEKYGAIQAQHYYQELTAEDWRLVRWIRKYKCSNPGDPVPGYIVCKQIKMHDEKTAKRIIEAMNQMLIENYR